MKQKLKKLTGYVLSATTAGIADICLFTVLTQIVFPKITPLYTTIATITARVVSSIINFVINCRFVFHGRPRRAIVRYYVLWTGQLCCSCILVNVLGHGLDLPLTVGKALGDVCLGFASYQIQNHWVYRENGGFYGSYACFARWLLRTFSHKFLCNFFQPGEPVVYVCRHLNMHGPYVTIKWIPFHVHPMILSVFFDRKTAVNHLTEYTFSVRSGKKVKHFNLAAQIVGTITPPLIHSLQAVPVYRNSGNSIATLKQGLKYLMKNESLIVYPDIHYTDNYDQPSDIYNGFLYLGDLYYKKTGKYLKFVPLIIDDENRVIKACEPVLLGNFRRDGLAATAALVKAINKDQAVCL